MKIKKKYVTAIAAATIIITAIIIHCYTLGMTNTEVERIPLSMAQVGDYLFIDENNNAYVVHKENFAAVDDTSKCVAVVFALETSYEDKKKGYKKNAYKYETRTVELVEKHWDYALKQWDYKLE